MIDPDYNFRNPYIDKTPPTRLLHPVEHRGVTSKGIPYHLKLTSVKTSVLRKHFHSPLDVPKLLGDWDLMNYWVSNMWEALYNPIWLWVKPSGGRGVIHGHHRFRLLNKMDAETMWFYALDAEHHKIGDLQIPVQVKQLLKENDRAPIRGTIRGTCNICGKSQRWVKKTLNRVNDVRMYCRLCGSENPYPWRGQI